MSNKQNKTILNPKAVVVIWRYHARTQEGGKRKVQSVDDFQATFSSVRLVARAPMKRRSLMVWLNTSLASLAVALIVSCLIVQHSTPFTAAHSIYLPVIRETSTPLSWSRLNVFFAVAIVPLSAVGCFIDKPRWLAAAYFALTVALIALQTRLVDYRFYLEVDMMEAMRCYDPTDWQSSINWDSTQVRLKCCGYDVYRDWWMGPLGDVPDSCCRHVTEGCGRNVTQEMTLAVQQRIWTRGCFPVINRLFLRIRILLVFVTCNVVALFLLLFSSLMAARFTEPGYSVL